MLITGVPALSYLLHHAPGKYRVCYANILTCSRNSAGHCRK